MSAGVHRKGAARAGPGTWGLVMVVLLIFFAACEVGDINFSGRQCPCIDGWVCDTATARCIPQGQLSKQDGGSPDSSADAAELPDASDAASADASDAGFGRERWTRVGWDDGLDTLCVKDDNGWVFGSDLECAAGHYQVSVFSKDTDTKAPCGGVRDLISIAQADITDTPVRYEWIESQSFFTVRMEQWWTANTFPCTDGTYWTWQTLQSRPAAPPDTNPNRAILEFDLFTGNQKGELNGVRFMATITALWSHAPGGPQLTHVIDLQLRNIPTAQQNGVWDACPDSLIPGDSRAATLLHCRHTGGTTGDNYFEDVSLAGVTFDARLWLGDGWNEKFTIEWARVLEFLIDGGFMLGPDGCTQYGDCVWDGATVVSHWLNLESQVANPRDLMVGTYYVRNMVLYDRGW